MKKACLIFIVLNFFIPVLHGQEIIYQENIKKVKPTYRIINNFWSNPFYYDFQNNMYGTSFNGNVTAGLKYDAFTFSGEVYEKYYTINSYYEENNLKGSWNFLGGAFDFFYEPVDWYEFKIAVGGAWFNSAYQNNDGITSATQGSMTFMFDAYFKPNKYIDIQYINILNLVFFENYTVPFYSGEIRCEFNPYIRWMNIYLGVGICTWIIEEPVDIKTGMFVWTVGLSFDLTPANFIKIKNNKIKYVKKEFKEKKMNVKKIKEFENIKKLKNAKKGDIISFSSIIFYPDSYKIKSESVPVLDAISEVLIENKKINIEIRGHTNDVGNPREELKLSKERAGAVRKYIVLMGVDAKRIKIYGFGSLYTKSNTVEEANRRVEIVISEREVF